MGQIFAALSMLVLVLVARFAYAGDVHGEVYSESNYIPQYGVLTDTQIRFIPYQNNSLTTYAGVATQLQNKTTRSQQSLYKKNLVLPTAGLRYSLLQVVSLLAEVRTEGRSRLGIIAGKMWQYEARATRFFTEVYAESLILPYFHKNPISTLWLKQGLRYEPAAHFYLDPFVEAYCRRSPSPELGRDTDQLRVGLRALRGIDRWNVGLLVFYAFPKEEPHHEEALFVVGGSF